MPPPQSNILYYTVKNAFKFLMLKNINARKMSPIIEVNAVSVLQFLLGNQDKRKIEFSDPQRNIKNDMTV